MSLPGSAAELLFGITPGPRDPAVADGYWVLLEPLTPGHHTIRIEASVSGFPFPFVIDVTYKLTVAAH